MGNQQLGKDQLKELQTDTKQKLSKKDIEKYHKFWFELMPNGLMTRETFPKFAQYAMPNAPSDAHLDYLFRAMDRDGNGTITFKEFLIFQSITAPTNSSLNPEELIDLAFSMVCQ